jgi:hypothetical protein
METVTTTSQDNKNAPTIDSSLDAVAEAKRKLAEARKALKVASGYTPKPMGRPKTYNHKRIAISGLISQEVLNTIKNKYPNDNNTQLLTKAFDLLADKEV